MVILKGRVCFTSKAGTEKMYFSRSGSDRSKIYRSYRIQIDNSEMYNTVPVLRISTCWKVGTGAQKCDFYQYLEILAAAATAFHIKVHTYLRGLH
jgi:hypothetical protein